MSTPSDYVAARREELYIARMEAVVRAARDFLEVYVEVTSGTDVNPTLEAKGHVLNDAIGAYVNWDGKAGT